MASKTFRGEVLNSIDEKVVRIATTFSTTEEEVNELLDSVK